MEKVKRLSDLVEIICRSAVESIGFLKSCQLKSHFQSRIHNGRELFAQGCILNWNPEGTLEEMDRESQEGQK